MAFRTPSALRLTLPLSAFALLSACSDVPKDSGHTSNDYQVGRYKIVHLPQTGETIEIDTTTGKTWLLLRTPPEEGGEVMSWEQIKDFQS